MVFLDRSRARGTDHLEWRIRLMGAGALLAVLGMYFEASWMIWLAIAVLVAGFFLRFLGDGGDEGDPADPEHPPDR